MLYAKLLDDLINLYTSVTLEQFLFVMHNRIDESYTIQSWHEFQDNPVAWYVRLNRSSHQKFLEWLEAYSGDSFHETNIHPNHSPVRLADHL